jgi:hypothetical protein
MRWLFSVVALVSLTVCGTFAFANCEDIYSQAVRDKSFTSDDWASLNSVYDRICTSSGGKQNFTWNSGMSIIVDSLPFSGTGNAAGSTDNWASFCTNYKDERFNEMHKKILSDTVVTEALISFNACKQIESIAHIVPEMSYTPDAVSITFVFETSQTFLKIGGVTGMNLQCQSNDAPIGQQSLSKDSSFEMKNNFSIICLRTNRLGASSKDIAANFPPASLTIATNIAPYTWNFPNDILYGINLASDAEARLNELRTMNQAQSNEIATRTNELTQLRNRLAGMHFSTFDFTVGEEEHKDYDCGSDQNQIARTFCSAAQAYTVTTIKIENGGKCGAVLYRAICVSY